MRTTYSTSIYSSAGNLALVPGSSSGQRRPNRDRGFRQWFPWLLEALFLVVLMLLTLTGLGISMMGLG